jgi:hypothetical protein
MPAEIRQFFDQYRDAFNRLDGGAVSALYQVPSMISSASGEGLFTNEDALLDNNIALCSHYEKAGFVRADYRVNHDFAQGDDFYVADLHWTITKADQSTDTFNTTYQLVKRQHSPWKIEHVCAYSEKRFWAEQ